LANSPTGFSGGLQVPLQPSQTGGFQVISGDDYVSQLIGVLVSDGDSENPFSRDGIGLEAVFSNLSFGGWRAKQHRKIVEVMQQLERAKIAKLVTTEWQAGPGEGEFSITIRYLSIETDTERDVKTVVRKR